MSGSMIGLGPHDMSGWAWFLMTTMTILWIVVAAAAVYIAVALTRDRRDGGTRS
jgi:hypothetical protein